MSGLMAKAMKQNDKIAAMLDVHDEHTCKNPEQDEDNTQLTDSFCLETGEKEFCLEITQQIKWTGCLQTT